jgi:subtilisin family serine protease/subtilisin-like proprotein convertase family protein
MAVFARQRNGLLGTLALAATMAWGCGTGGDDGIRIEDPTPRGIRQPVEFAQGSVIVKFKPGASVSAIRAAASKVGGTISDKNGDGVYDGLRNIGKSGLAVVQLDKSASVPAAVQKLAGDPAVAYAEPNFIYRISAVPNDPRFGELYGLDNTGQSGGVADADVDGPEAWDNSVGSSNIVVGVVDTGVDYNHPDLAANIWTNPGEVPDNGIDDDGNGVVDDVHGFNAINGSGNPNDDHGHGTHVSGTIGAVGNNGIGVAGVNWETSIVGIKFLDAGGSGTTEDAIEAIDYAVGLRNSGVNLRVLSNSWGGGGFSQALLDSILAANEAGILFVAAAGNFSSDTDQFPNYPSGYDAENIVSVAATDRRDVLADFSNWGATTVDLAAPGVDTVSTWPGGGYESLSGTSMATPHVSGAAALVLSSNETLSVAELKEALFVSGDPLDQLGPITVTGRRLNAAAALDEAGPPVPRFNLSVAPGARVISQGESTSYTVDVSTVAGFTGDVALSVATTPAIDATVTVTPNVVSAPGTATVTVVTSEATARGSYSIAITGTSGDLVKTRTVQLRVRAAGTVEIPFPSTDTPLPIPDVTTITSVISVDQPIVIEEVYVDVDITHTFIGDLRVSLTSPTGTEAVLHDRAGGGSDDLVATFALPTQFSGEDAVGDWTLTVADLAGADIGTLNSWTLRIVGVPGAPSYGVSVSPRTQTVRQTQTATYDIDVASYGGFEGTVALDVTVPAVLLDKVTLSPTVVAPPGAATLVVATDCEVDPGTYELVITATGSNGVVRTRPVTLDVRAVSSATVVYPSTDTPVAIPVGGSVSSAITAPDGVLEGLSVTVDLDHPLPATFFALLTAPNGFQIGVNPDGTTELPDFVDQNVAGTWTLTVFDGFTGLAGTLVSWQLNATVGSTAPYASFEYTQTAGTVSFTSTVTPNQCGGAIAGYHWDFGDGSESFEPNPTHTYAAVGTYTVTLTVIDRSGNSTSVSQDVVIDSVAVPPVLAIESVSRDRNNFEFRVNLSWTGARGRLVELYRNGTLINIPNNSGRYGDTFRNYATSYTWQLAERSVEVDAQVSNEVSIVFGSLTGDEVTVVETIDGVATSRRLKVTITD